MFRLANLGVHVQKAVDAAIEAASGPGQKSHHVYVIQLQSCVRQDRRFKGHNRVACQSKPAFYVGMTGIGPVERFHQHLDGVHSSYYPRRYALRLVSLPELGKPMTRADAEMHEARMAEALRQDGYGVIQN